MNRKSLCPVDNATGFPNIHWIVIFPVDTTFYLWNNLDQE